MFILFHKYMHLPSLLKIHNCMIYNMFFTEITTLGFPTSAFKALVEQGMAELCRVVANTLLFQLQSWRGVGFSVRSLLRLN